jgi:LysM repeat protein
VLVGSDGLVTLRIENAMYLYGIDLRLDYDPISCLGSTPGSIPAADFVFRNDCGNGSAYYSVVEQPPRAPATGTGDIVSLSFRCTRAGTISLHFGRAILLDSTGRRLPEAASDGTITCKSQSTILGYHYVQTGETLLCIARAYSVSAFAIANQNWVFYPFILYPGQRLAIPNVPFQNSAGPTCVPQFGGGGTTPVPFTPPPTSTPVSATCRAIYHVRYGDTLFGIAWRYGISVSAIATKNNLLNPNWIFAGQWLCIPY